MSNIATTKKAEDTPAICVLKNINRGSLLSSFNGGLKELVESIRQNGGSGSVTLTLRLKNVDNTDVPQVTASGSVRVNPSKPREVASYFFVNPDNELSRTDSRQQMLEIEAE